RGGKATLHRQTRPCARGLRRADVVGIRALADAEQCHRPRPLLEQEDRRTFADAGAVAVAAERVAGARRQGAQRVEAVERQAADRVDSADDSGIAKAGADETLGRGEGLAARGAGSVDRVGGSGDPEKRGDEIGEVSRLLLRVAVTRWPRPRG